jgi:CRP-like cAMP-binding protein
MALEDDVRNLARNATFAVMEAEALRLIAFSAETRILRAGDVLFRRDDLSDAGYVVVSGTIALDGAGEGAAGALLVRAPGLIGDLALIVETRRPASAVAREPSSVLKISRSLFLRVLQEFPNSAERIRCMLAEDLARMSYELEAVRRSAFAP